MTEAENRETGQSSSIKYDELHAVQMNVEMHICRAFSRARLISRAEYLRTHRAVSRLYVCVLGAGLER